MTFMETLAKAYAALRSGHNPDYSGIMALARDFDKRLTSVEERQADHSQHVGDKVRS